MCLCNAWKHPEGMSLQFAATHYVEIDALTGLKIYNDMRTTDISDLLNRLRAGEWVYGLASDVPKVGELLSKCADACFDLNALRPSAREERTRILSTLLGSMGKDCVINSPFRCDFGFNIHIGDKVVGNFNLTILDEAEVRIGNRVMIGPNCSLLTIIHAKDADKRAAGLMQALPIEVEDDVWIAADVTVLPGVTIGKGSVIGAGSVVTKSIPAGVFAAGNPCKVVKPI